MMNIMHYYDNYRYLSFNFKKEKTTLSQQQKFDRAHKLAQEMASLASEVGMEEFQRRFDTMKSLEDSWIKGKEAVVIEADEDSSSGKSIFVVTLFTD